MSSTSSADSAARRRENAIWQGAATSVVAKAVSALCLLAQVPVAVGYLGTELFGLWMTLTSVLSLAAFADLGVGAGVQNEAGTLLGREQRAGIKATCANGLALLAMVALALVIALLAIWQWLPWENWLNLTDPSVKADARQGLLVLVILFGATFPLTSLSRLAFGLQLGWLANLWLAAINVLTLAAVLAARRASLNFTAFVVVAALPVLLGHLGLAFQLFRRQGWRWSDLPYPTAGHMSRLLRAGLPFTLPQLGALSLTFVPPLVLSSVLGPAAVTPWNIAHRLLGLFGVAQQILLTQLWPAYTEAHARGDWVWLKRNYRRSILGGLCLIALPQALFCFWGEAAVDIWTRGAVVLPAGFAFWAGLHAAVISVSQAPAFLLNSLGRMHGQAVYGFGATVVALAIAPRLAREFGLSGISMGVVVLWSTVYLPLIYLDAAAGTKRLQGANSGE
jgi:O-antigen/teichoic acid export membrane protein